jgi:hypothetical protein
VSMINQVRKIMPRLLGKKSYHILMDDLNQWKLEEINYLIYSGLTIDWSGARKMHKDTDNFLVTVGYNP